MCFKTVISALAGGLMLWAGSVSASEPELANYEHLIRQVSWGYAGHDVCTEDGCSANLETSCDVGCESNGAECTSYESACGCYDWSGRYFGLQLGGSWLNPNTAAANFIQPNSDGFIGGGFVGVNRQVNRVVMGLEADYNGTALDRTVPCFNPMFVCNAESDWNASFRGRLGIARDRTLYYATVGYAAADYEGFTRLIGTGQTFADRKTLSGVAVGGGIEHAVTDCTRFRVEYRYEGFGPQTMAYDIPYAVRPDIHMVLASMNWKF